MKKIYLWPRLKLFFCPGGSSPKKSPMSPLTGALLVLKGLFFNTNFHWIGGTHDTLKFFAISSLSALFLSYNFTSYNMHLMVRSPLYDISGPSPYSRLLANWFPFTKYSFRLIYWSRFIICWCFGITGFQRIHD